MRNFNPHSHAGSDLSFPIFLKRTNNISIHTPTQGVTPSLNSFKMFSISIHTPTQGVTIFCIMPHFFYSISIHTPTQGVTVKGYYDMITSLISIHTPTQGVTAKLYNISNTTLNNFCVMHKISLFLLYCIIINTIIPPIFWCEVL